MQIMLCNLSLHYNERCRIEKTQNFDAFESLQPFEKINYNLIKYKLMLLDILLTSKLE